MITVMLSWQSFDEVTLSCNMKPGQGDYDNHTIISTSAKEI